MTVLLRVLAMAALGLAYRPTALFSQPRHNSNGVSPAKEDVPAAMAARFDGLAVRLSLNIGREAGSLMPADWARSGARLLLRDIDLEFASAPAAGNAPGPLPGVAGPRPELSSGARALRVRGRGGATLLDKRGVATVPLRGGAWELVRRPSALAGQLVLTLDAPDGAVRRDAEASDPRVDSGARLYLTAPVWDAAQLEELRAKLDGARAKASDAQRLKARALEEFRDEGANLLTKALAFRQACAAREAEDLACVSAYEAMAPAADGEGGEGTIEVAGDGTPARPTLQIGALGSVWVAKPGSSRDRVLLGTCSFEAVDAEQAAAEAADAEQGASAASVACQEAEALRAQAARLKAEAAALEEA